MREVIESPYKQGVDEAKAYVITVPSTWGTPTFINHAGVLKLENADGTYTEDATKLTGTQTSDQAVITTARIHSLVEGNIYRYEGKFDNSEGDTLEFFLRIYAEL